MRLYRVDAYALSLMFLDAGRVLAPGVAEPADASDSKSGGRKAA